PWILELTGEASAPGPPVAREPTASRMGGGRSMADQRAPDMAWQRCGDSTAAAGLDGPAPRPRLVATRLDERLEPFHVALRATSDEPKRIADRLDRTLGLDVELEGHPSRRVGEPVERHHARVRGAFDGMPGDPLVGLLLTDLGGPALLDPGDVGRPGDVGVVQLFDLVDALHEERELLELGPLVVGDPDRDLDIHGFDDLRHDRSFSLSGKRNAHRLGGRFADASVPRD